MMSVRVIVALSDFFPSKKDLPEDLKQKWEFAFPVFEDRISAEKKTFAVGDVSLTVLAINFLEESKEMARLVRTYPEDYLIMLTCSYLEYFPIQSTTLTKYILAAKYVVFKSEESPVLTTILPFDPHAIIIGQTPIGEMIVRYLNTPRKKPPMRPIIFRCSIFYPRKESKYTLNPPAYVGYDFDLFKSLESIDLLLSHYPTLEAVGHKDIREVEKAIEELNQFPYFKEHPIISL